MKVNTMSTRELVMLIKEAAQEFVQIGLRPERQLADYLSTGDPTHLNQLPKELRFKICRIDYDEFLEALLLYLIY